MPAYTYVGSGTVVAGAAPTSLTPTTHASTVAGNLLILWTMHRAAATLTSISGWTRLNGASSASSVECWARIATGSDSATVTWSGTSRILAWIETYSGNVYTDLSTIVAHTDFSNNSSTATAPITGSMVITTANCLLLLGSIHKNTSSPAGMTLVAPSGTTLTASRIDITASSGYEAGGAYVQQTTATDWGGADFTITGGTSDAAGSTGLMLALKTASSLTKKVKLLAHSSAATVTTGVSGVVFNAPGGTEIVGSKLAEFTAQGFAAGSGADAGYAVLKVAETDLGGATLPAVGSSLRVYAKTSTNFTPIWTATVIEE